MTKEERRQYNKDRRARLKAQGLCITCGKRAAVPGRVQCRPCLQRHVENTRNSRMERCSTGTGTLYVRSQEDGYLSLAAAILKAQVSAYTRALQAYTLHYNTRSEKEAEEEVLKIEEELLSPYYAILTLQAIDLQNYIKQQRKMYAFREG